MTSIGMIENATPTRARRDAPAVRTLALITAAALAFAGAGPAVVPAQAQEHVTNAFRVIRDTEIENLVRDYA
ncbi:MAG: hypothetical protein ACREED_04485, partial [Stellaceae bacterium]